MKDDATIPQSRDPGEGFNCALIPALKRRAIFRCPSGTKYLFVVGLGCLISLASASAQTNKTWNGSAGTDWFNANNWTPAGVPATNDTVNFTNGTINLTAPVSISGQFNWSGGVLLGNPLTIATNGVLNLNGGSGTLFVRNALTNGGTVNWASGNLNLDTCVGAGPIVNLASGLWDMQSSASLGANCGLTGTNTYFQNQGTVRKSASTGVFARSRSHSTVRVSMMTRYRMRSNALSFPARHQRS